MWWATSSGRSSATASNRSGGAPRAYPSIALRERRPSLELVCIGVYHSHGVSSREVIRRLGADGWYEVARRGSHVQLKHLTKPGRVTVPHPRRDLAVGTLRSIEKQAGVRLR